MPGICHDRRVAWRIFYPVITGGLQGDYRLQLQAGPTFLWKNNVSVGRTPANLSYEPRVDILLISGLWSLLMMALVHDDLLPADIRRHAGRNSTKAREAHLGTSSEKFRRKFSGAAQRRFGTLCPA